MKVEIMEITPALAEQWLTTNTENRSIRKTVVERYAGDMLRGDWKLNGEPIIKNGSRLLNGQHRLLACIKAGVPFQSVVVFDAPTDAMQTIDQGVSRTLGDVLRWKGYTNQNVLASAIRMGWRWDNGVLLRPVHPTISQTLEWLEQNERIVSASRFAIRLVGAPLRIRGSVAGPFYMKALDAAGDTANEFFDRLIDGEHIAHGNPVYALRKSMMNNAAKPYGRLTANPMLAMLIKAWNAWVMHEPVELLIFRRGGGERFPVMLDLDGNPISKEQ